MIAKIIQNLENKAELQINSLETRIEKIHVKEGDKVRKGQKLIRFDKKLLAEKGLDATTVFLLTNSDEYPDAKFETGMKAEAANTVVLKF